MTPPRRAKTAQRARRFALGVTCVTLTVFVLEVLDIPSKVLGQLGLKLQVVGTVVTSDTHLWAIQYGIERGQLVFVVFQGVARDLPLSGAVTSSSSGHRSAAELTKPDGTIIRLPIAHQLIQIVDGEYSTSAYRVTRSELDLFLKSSPGSYTTDELIRHVEKHRKR